jgi:hypothetical protein
MTENRSAGRRGRSGLPDDDDGLAALSALANTALPSTPAPSVASRPLAAVSPLPDRPEPAAPAPAAAPALPTPPPGLPTAEATARRAVDAPRAADGDSDAEADDDGTANFIKQSTVQVDAQVAQRFRRYQDRDRPKPSNAEVIFRAIDAAQGRYRDIIDARRPQLPEGRRLGRAVPGRRPAGTRLATQVNFRPTVGEEAEIKQLSRDSGADSMSAFVNAVLDEFLPGAPRAARA